MAQLGAYGEETWFGLGDRDLALHIARTARVRGGRPPDRGVPGPPAVAGDRGPGAADGRRAGGDRGAHRRRLAGVPGVLRPPPPGAGRPRAAVRGAGRGRAHPGGPRRAGRGRGDRDRAVEPARVRGADPGRAGHARGDRGGAGARAPGSRRCPRSSAAGRSRDRRTGCWSPSATRRAPWAWPGCTRTCATCSCWTTVDAGLAPAVEALGLRPVVTDTIMDDDASRARLAGEVLEAVRR